MNARIIQVRHRPHATYSRQPRQVRKEATVTGSCVCSGVPVPGLIFGFHKILSCCKTTCCKKTFTNPLQLFAQETRPRFVSNSRFQENAGESSGKKDAHLFIKVSFSNCYHPRLRHLVSRASEVSGSTGCLGNRLRLVASTRSGSPGGVRPPRARISNGRGRSRFRYRCLPELYPRMDAAGKGLLRRLIRRRVATSGLRLLLLRTHTRERFRCTGRHPGRTRVELRAPSARVRHSAANPAEY